MLQWTVLDKRVHQLERQIQRGPSSLEVQGLAKKGAVSTWGIDQNRMTDWQRKEGFKYFRIIQIGPNYEGSYSLILSALEIYGMTNDVMNWRGPFDK